ncbi:unnamed protein product [Trichobilharzia regenti]|nr:unnamed protein product [Trichobilharzia regenti]
MRLSRFTPNFYDLLECLHSPVGSTSRNLLLRNNASLIILLSLHHAITTIISPPSLSLFIITHAITSIQHTKWPSEARKLLSQSSRWSENTTLTSAPSPPLKESNQPIGKKGNTSGKNKRSQKELNHCYVLVNANKAEGFWINRDGGLFLSPSLNPFLSVRIPKRVCPTQERAIFKVSFSLTFPL